jgi:hypothetical protein
VNEAIFPDFEIIPKRTGALVASKVKQRDAIMLPLILNAFIASSFRPPFSAFQAREQGYDRDRRGSGYLFQHQHFPGSCFRRV